MKTKKLCLLFCLSLFIVSSYGQISTDFSDIQKWSFKFKDPIIKEQAIKASVLIGSCNNVILARTDINGEVSIFSTGVIDWNEVEGMIKSIDNLRYNKPKSVYSERMDFLKSYALMLQPEESNYNGDRFEVIPFKNLQKQELSFAIAKSIWVKEFPDKYAATIIPSSIETDEEKAERLAKENKVDFKSKQ